MPRTEKGQEKLENIIISLRDGLSEFASLIEEINKSSSMLLKLFSKTEKELKSLKGDKILFSEPEESPAAPVIGIRSGQDAREKAANLLFNMLSGSKSGGISASAALSGSPSLGTVPVGPPRSVQPGAPSSGPPTRPPSAPSITPPSVPPSAPGGSPMGLPPPPKLPPKTPGAVPPGVTAQPSFMKGPPGISPPPIKPAATMGAEGSPVAPVAAVAGGSGGAGLSSLRDEMLKELDRLKKIMRGG